MVSKPRGVRTDSCFCYNPRVSTPSRSISPLLILLLAFALRVYRLDAQSIWYDEGLSIALAEQSPAQTVTLSASTDHPPLHALLLGVWIRLAGNSDFSVRFLSVSLGVIVVALAYVLGCLFDPRAGLIGAGLTALSPLAVYYSQETRGYMLLTALILAAAIACVKWLSGDTRRSIGMGYAAALIAALYTHYFAAFAWAAFNVAVVVIAVYRWVVHRRGAAAGMSLTLLQRSGNGKAQSKGESPASHVPVSRQLANWLTLQAIILVCFLPWLPSAIAQVGSNATYFPGRVTWETVVGDTWRAFSVGERGDASIVGWVWSILIAIGLIAAFAGSIRHGGPTHSSGHRQAQRNANMRTLRLRVSVAMLLPLFIIIPLMLMSGLAWLKPKFAPRYLLPSLPAFVVLASLGVAQLIDGLRSRFCRLASIGLVIGLTLPLADAASLLSMYTDPALARPDERAVAAYVASHAEPTDAIILLGGHQAPAFEHYYHGPAAIVPLPPGWLPAAQTPIDAQAVAQLAALAASHPRIWLVLWQNAISDPTDVILNALIAQAKRLDVGQNFHGMSLLLFDVRDATFSTQPQHIVDFAFTQPLRLVGYNVNTVHPTAGERLIFGLYLQADSAIPGDYQVSVQLIGPDGSLVAQDDHIAGADSYPTSLWRPGSLILNRFEIALPTDIAPGEYRIVVSLYSAAGRLTLSDGSDHIDLIQFSIRD